MPKLELKTVQKDLEQGVLWPFYWLYGDEKLKSRELLQRIRKVALGDLSASQGVWGEEVFEGNETDVAVILDSALSPSFSGGVRLIVVQEAHALKNPENLSSLFGPPQKLSELASVCVCIAKDLDARKKFSKVLIEKAAVVPCEGVAEDQREVWVRYLAKRRGLDLTPTSVMQLNVLDPWSLDRVDQELEKYSVAGSLAEVILDDTGTSFEADQFLESFFSRNLAAALPQVSRFAHQVDEALPLLGLLGWNVRQLAVVIDDRNHGTRYSKLNPYLVDRFRRWSSKWSLGEVIQLQNELLNLDFSLKQTPLLPLGLWSHLVTQYCR
jgi:DNA polymerase III delta subunit